jgi:hypothetical protein
MSREADATKAHLGWRIHQFDFWQEFRNFIEDDLSPAYTLFRGQFNADWGLTTSLDRLLRTLPDGFRNERVPSVPT